MVPLALGLVRAASRMRPSGRAVIGDWLLRRSDSFLRSGGVQLDPGSRRNLAVRGYGAYGRLSLPDFLRV